MKKEEFLKIRNVYSPLAEAEVQEGDDDTSDEDSEGTGFYQKSPLDDVSEGEGSTKNAEVKGQKKTRR